MMKRLESFAVKHNKKVGAKFTNTLVVKNNREIFKKDELMYLIEHTVNPGFRNIPQSIYWAIVTITTVGYGDVAPITILGKLMACVIMLTGFAIIAVPMRMRSP